jgi:hypothetical protein
MNNLQTPSGQWRKQKAKLKSMFPELTDDDFKYEYGMKESMLTNLQLKLGKSRSELNELITEGKDKGYSKKSSSGSKSF